MLQIFIKNILLKPTLHNHSDGSENKHDVIMAKKHDGTTGGGRHMHTFEVKDLFSGGGVPRSQQNIFVFGITLLCYYLIITNWSVTNHSRNY